MSFSFYIAKRYLFTKTSNNAINIITIIASFGVIVGALALFIILSGFSGLRTFSYNLLDITEPDIKITTTKGKSFFITEKILETIHNNTNIKEYTTVVEERVFLEYNDKNEIAYIKGVESNYTSISKVDSTLYMGTWLDEDFENMAIIGNGISRKLSLGILNYGEPLSIMIPKPGTGFTNLNNPFYKVDVQVSGIYSGNEDFENKFVFTNISLARELLRYKRDQVTAIELLLNSKLSAKSVAQKLQIELGDTFKVQTKAQLNEIFYKVINTENLISYLIFTLIVIIALFNVIGAIIMMIIDKKRNLKTLFSLGASIKEVKKIFIFQGFLLSFFGMIIGLTMGVILVFLQLKYSLFMITQTLAYPVELKGSNVLIVFVTITVLGFIASKIASGRITKTFIEK